MGSKSSGRRKPRQQKIIQGTFRRGRNPAREPRAETLGGMPESPKHLGERARAFWRRMGPGMVRAGVLTALDLPAFEILCLAYEELLDAHDAVYFTAKGKPRTLRQYMRGKNSQTMPEFNALKTARAAYKSYAAEFGIMPASRNRIDLKPPPEGEKDPMEELLEAE